MKTLPLKPIINIKSSTKILSEESHKNLFDTIMKEKKINHAIRAIGVLAGDRIAGQPFPLFTLEDLKEQYQRIISHYQMLGAEAEADVKDLAHSVCQVIDVKTMNEIQEMIEDLYIKSLTDIEHLWQHSNNLLVNRNQLSNEELLYEQRLHDYARQAVYGDFNKILTVTLFDFLQQDNIRSLLKKNIKQLEKISTKAPIAISSKITSTLFISEKVISWFENSGFILKSNDLNALQKARSELRKIKNSQIISAAAIQSFMEIQKSFLDEYKLEYQLSLYTIPKLVAVNARYNSELQFRANLPSQMLPVNLRARCHRVVQKIKSRFAENPDATKTLNTNVVEISGEEHANPHKVEYFTLAKVAEDLNLVAGFTTFIQDYCEAQFMKSQNEREEEKLEKQRTGNFLALYDCTFLVDDFMMMLPALSQYLLKETNLRKNSKKTRKSIERQQRLSKLNEVLNHQKTVALKFLDCKKQLDNLTKQLIATPISASQLTPQIAELQKTLSTIGTEFKQNFQRLSPEVISVLVNSISQLDDNNFGFMKIGENKFNNFYGNASIGFILLLDYVNKKPKKLWSTQAESLSSSLNRHIFLTMENPVLGFMKRYGLRKDKPMPIKATSPTEEILEKILDGETLKITNTILKLYLNFCKYDDALEKTALAELRPKLSTLTKEQQTAVRKTNELSEKYRIQFLINHLDQVATFLKTLDDDEDTIHRLQNLYRYVIAINDKKISSQIEKVIKEHNLWKKILSEENADSSHSLIHWAVYYNRRTILTTLFHHAEEKLRSEKANQNFISETGEKFSLLAIAVIEGHKESMVVLLHNSANLHTQNGKDNKTALELAAEFGQVKAMQILLRAYGKELAKSNNNRNLKDNYSRAIKGANLLCFYNPIATKLLLTAQKKLQTKIDKEINLCSI